MKRRRDCMYKIKSFFNEESRFNIKDLDLFNRIVEYIVTTPSQNFSAESLSNYFANKDDREVSKITLYKTVNDAKHKMLDTMVDLMGKVKINDKKYTEEFSISKDKFYLVFNKCNKNSIDERVLREIFNEYKVLGKIMLREYYEYIINNNKANQKKIEKEMKRIEKKGGFCGKSTRKYNKSKSFSREFRNNPKLISKINIRDGYKYSDRYRH